MRASDKEEWIRKPALLVLLYEAIVSKALDYDYAPISELVEDAATGKSTRTYLNISQEGKSDLDFLREEDLVNALKLSSASYQPVTCYQISEKGLEVVVKISKADKLAVHDIAYAPGTLNLVRVEWDDEERQYWLEDVASGFRRLSSVTETEDVSYVSSAYIPQCLRLGGRPTLSNAHRAHECAISDSSIRDQLDEIVTLNSVSLLVAEFVPFGANQIVQLNASLGSADRAQGGFFTAVLPPEQTEEIDSTRLTLDPGLTAIHVLDYTPTNHVNFEADIHFPEAPGVVQVETFGCALSAAGSCVYGMQVEAVMDRIKDNISLDHLARLLVDVHTDSSQIVDSVLSAHQRALLALVFADQASTRDKINLIIANEITPHLTAEEYLDKGEYENELKQVLGDTRAAFDVSEHDTLVIGAKGLLLAGPNSRHHEPLLCAFLHFEAMNLFTQSFFSRLFILVDDTAKTRKLIETSERDPNRPQLIRDTLALLARQVLALEEVLGYLREALDDAVIPLEPPEQAGRALFERLQLGALSNQLKRRVKDLTKTMSGARHELGVLKDMASGAQDERNSQQRDSIKRQGRAMLEANEVHERAVRTLLGIQLLLAGCLAFDLLDRITGDWTVMDRTWLQNFAEVMIYANPGLWFFFSLLAWVIVAAVAFAIMLWLRFRSQGVVTIASERRARIQLRALSTYLRTKLLTVRNPVIGAGAAQNILTSCMTRRKRIITKAVCELRTLCGLKKTKKSGVAPYRQSRYVLCRSCKSKNFTLTWLCVLEKKLEYDEEHAFMLRVTISYRKRQAANALAFNADELYSRLSQELDRAGIFVDKDSSAAVKTSASSGAALPASVVASSVATASTSSAKKAA